MKKVIITATFRKVSVMATENIIVKTTTEGVDFKKVEYILKQSGLSEAPAEVHEKAFTNSAVKVFLYDGKELIGVARALSDMVSQGAIYNVALLDEYQGQGLGRLMIEKLIEQMPGQNVILYTHPQTVWMYEKFGFRRAKSAMEYFPIEDSHKEWMENEGFFLPEGYRFVDEYKREDMKGPKWK